MPRFITSCIVILGLMSLFCPSGAMAFTVASKGPTQNITLPKATARIVVRNCAQRRRCRSERMMPTISSRTGSKATPSTPKTEGDSKSPVQPRSSTNARDATPSET